MHHIDLLLFLCSCLREPTGSVLESPICLTMGHNSLESSRFWYTEVQRLVRTNIKPREQADWKTAYCLLAPAILETNPFTVQALSNELATSVLIEAGYNPAADNNHALITACTRGYVDTVKLLLEDRRVDCTSDDNLALRLASDWGRSEIVELLLERSGEVNLPDLFKRGAR